MKCNATIASTKRMKVYTGCTVNLLSRQALFLQLRGKAIFIGITM